MSERSRSKELGNGFIDHGVATPISNHRGIVATVDGDGRNVALVWLFDHTGCYAILVIDVETGKSQQIPMPFTGGDCPFSSVLSTRNRFYTHFNSHFVEFDPVKRAFTAWHKSVPQMAMGMTEDDRGVIWSVTYPNSGVASFDPATGVFRDYGHIHKENWPQYQRSVAADDAGWIYFGVGNTWSQILSFDPKSGVGTPVIPESQRVAAATGFVYRDMNGKVYGRPAEDAEDKWYELYEGRATLVGTHPNQNKKPIITDSQGLFYDRFPDGKKLVKCDLVERLVAVEDPQTGIVTERSFTYTSDGAHIMGVATAPNGTISGGTSFPMRFFSYDPRNDTWMNHDSHGQCNTIAAQGDRFYVGGYVYGHLLEWDPSKPWVPTDQENHAGNPRFLMQCDPDIYRPHKLLAHPDGKTIIMGGTPGYGYTGGGLLFWDRETQTGTLLKHGQLLENHSTMSLVALPGGKLLGGSTTDAGTGGERKAPVAELYLMDMESKSIEWRAAVLGGVQSYLDLHLAKNGIVYGIADGGRFFAFNPENKEVIREESIKERLGGVGYQQGPRKLIQTPEGVLYLLCLKVIVRVDLETHELIEVAKPPVGAHYGGDVLDGRLYYACGSHLYSYKL